MCRWFSRSLERPRHLESACYFPKQVAIWAGAAPLKTVSALAARDSINRATEDHADVIAAQTACEERGVEQLENLTEVREA